jgi:hypothetical protein
MYTNVTHLVGPLCRSDAGSVEHVCRTHFAPQGRSVSCSASPLSTNPKPPNNNNHKAALPQLKAREEDEKWLRALKMKGKMDDEI